MVFVIIKIRIIVVSSTLLVLQPQTAPVLAVSNTLINLYNLKKYEVLHLLSFKF